MSTRPTASLAGRVILGMLSCCFLMFSSANAKQPPPWGKGGLASKSYDKCADPHLQRGQFRIIPDQPYALCFPGRCWFFNGVLYCACEKLPEDAPPGQRKEWDDSISLSLDIYDNDEFQEDSNVCTVMENGNSEGYRVSTFSLSPAYPVYEGDDGAVYRCPSNSPGSYAQCDGGLCFERVSQMTGAQDLFGKNQIMCSCPIVEASGRRGPYNAYGPFDPNERAPRQCSPEDCAMVCGAGSAPIRNGTGPDIPIGAPIGSGRVLACELAAYQQQTDEPYVPPIQECVCQYDAGPGGGDILGTWSARSRIIRDPCRD